MTDEQRDIYILLCMAGRSREATDYRDKCEAQDKQSKAPSQKHDDTGSGDAQ